MQGIKIYFVKKAKLGILVSDYNYDFFAVINDTGTVKALKKRYN